MSCYHPWSSYRLRDGSISSKGGPDAEPIRLPCGACIGCHLDRARTWSVRCRHEAETWTHNAFLTLTYNDENLPWHGSLCRKTPRDFIRYLRRNLDGVEAAPDGSGRRPIRFFGCGEYGSQRGRAHYHFLLFNVRFEDAESSGRDLYTSRLVSQLWPYGSHQIGSFSAASASYVAGYASKKVSAWARAHAYDVVDPATGEVFSRVPEFAMMSLKPPIGKYWYDRFKTDLKQGFVVLDGQRLPVPRLYADKLKSDAPEVHEEMEWQRLQEARKYSPADRSEARLAVRENIAKSRRKFFATTHLED